MAQHVLLIGVDHQGDSGANPNGDGLFTPRKLASQEKGTFGQAINLGVLVKLLHQGRPTSQQSYEQGLVDNQHVSLKTIGEGVECFLPRAPGIFLQGEGWQPSVTSGGARLNRLPRCQSENSFSAIPYISSK